LRPEARGGTRARPRRAALKANPGKTANAIARLAGVSRATVVAARSEARKPRETAKTAKQPTERRQRAQKFLKEALAHGPRGVSDVEALAAKAHVDLQTLEQARGDLGVVTSRGNSPGNALSVQWSLPG
jgi:hypothetical protein